MISLRDIRKVYLSDNIRVDEIRGVSLEIGEGEICGIIGFSGAGKSTLVRCINLLENPTSGKIFVGNQELTSLSPKELREARKNIGMIFQHFNLMQSKTVSKNIAYPLKGSGLSKEQIKKRVSELLELVGLSDKATSALDPQTTQSILSLLKDINKKLGLTIVIITHEMHVVKEICDTVAVIENGNIVEYGDLIQIFTKPKIKVTKDFIVTIFQENKIYELLEKDYFKNEIRKDEVLAKIVFVGQNTGKAFISKISRKFKIDASILFGNIEIIQNTPIGYLVVKLSGQIENILKVESYLKENNIELKYSVSN
ncbi:ATP-binding cassette domain-containing protein [Romboutsia sedimentorum]|uniref:methionine ABC transporter ATP-binding protein n=1 Tax=Romboutsia sedimentorum TaxID=1368474 RepID=UPI0024DE8805|nr:ATP-binding cassette domain-containing protein [Romboutsia sedimentorum]MDK2586095.1 ATP-binding cassette domain-containing protein [Romboutsia sedimentorum]